jgi:hypothetical protein
LLGLLFDPEDGGDLFLRNVTEIHGVTTQKTVLFIVTAVEVKVKLCLCLINSALCSEGVRGSGGRASSFLTSARVVGERSALCCGWFPRGERTPGTHRIGDCVGPKADQGTVQKRRISCTCQ